MVPPIRYGSVNQTDVLKIPSAATQLWTSQDKKNPTGASLFFILFVSLKTGISVTGMFDPWFSVSALLQL